MRVARPVQRAPRSDPYTYLPTTVCGIWMYLYLVVDVWSRKIVAWGIAEREVPAIAADLVTRACLRERISRARKHPLNSSPITVMRCVPPHWRAG